MIKMNDLEITMIKPLAYCFQYKQCTLIAIRQVIHYILIHSESILNMVLKGLFK